MILSLSFLGKSSDHELELELGRFWGQKKQAQDHELFEKSHELELENDLELYVTLKLLIRYSIFLHHFHVNKCLKQQA